jgi:hypothetical protein
MTTSNGGTIGGLVAVMDAGWNDWTSGRPLQMRHTAIRFDKIFIAREWLE